MTTPDAHAEPVALPDDVTEPLGTKKLIPLDAFASVYVPAPEYDQFVEPVSVPLPEPDVLGDGLGLVVVPSHDDVATPPSVPSRVPLSHTVPPPTTAPVAANVPEPLYEPSNVVP